MKASSFFTKNLLQWHEQHNRRQMPWKGIRDAYRIWLSEVMLQQTRVEQGLPYYERFTAKYPTIRHLADAPDDEVYKLWEGLGYYSRCANLLRTARHIAYEREGAFPQSLEGLLQLKGVGPYTAAAIASFAFGLPAAVVDGNVVRILARFFGLRDAFQLPEGKRRFQQLADDLLPASQPAAYNQAIMDFGATVCTPRQPLCHQCPLQSKCVAYRQGLIDVLPLRIPKPAKKERFFTYCIFSSQGLTLVFQRQERDIWKNLYEFALIEEEGFSSDMAMLARRFTPTSVPQAADGPFQQLLTHQKILARFVPCPVPEPFDIPGGRWVDAATLASLSFPGVINRWLEQR